jgi:hypothetical protein
MSMESTTRFSADWLTMREPADARARSSEITQRLVEVLGPGRTIDVLDLGGGTGANVRYLCGRLPSPQRWRLVDNDQSLLDQLPTRMSTWAAACGAEVVPHGGGLRLRGGDFRCELAMTRVDLNAVDHPRLVAGHTLVTASALLDLVSDRWLLSLASACRESGAAVLFALSYDGRIEYSPEEPEDELIRDLVNQHQRTDKGFGVALGPDAAARAEQCFAAHGYHMHSASSDWVLSPGEGELQRSLIDGWAQASAEIAPGHSRTIELWRRRRLAHVDRLESRLIVGHQDLGGWPREVRK